ncbi:hypothetical protein PRCB_14480 [Pantoea rodasii]|uniref:Uncharacterized protein n=1 Tax=Pantoea rodasii TaxID=1076549 RepID=A0A2M9WAT8_9GAMM|nr:hypothetical protein [Pantoea rodasii]ORM65839.1 hypothetical protein HA45_03460 [Pantoea rodasii]PJZ04632.1 hypothetical protein PRCB_14480 [Pantoea rodasii]
MSSESTEIGFSGWRLLLSFVIFIYIMIYTLFAIKYFFLSWAGDYGFLNDLIHPSDSLIANEEIKLAIFTVLGALFGGATLGITSLHRYSAVTKTLDIDHLWGYLMAPILSIVIGILIFCLLYSGLMVLNGGTSVNAGQTSVKIGYLSLGAICSYNWDVFVMKLQKLSKHVSDE